MESYATSAEKQPNLGMDYEVLNDESSANGSAAQSSIHEADEHFETNSEAAQETANEESNKYQLNLKFSVQKVVNLIDMFQKRGFSAIAKDKNSMESFALTVEEKKELTSSLSVAMDHSKIEMSPWWAFVIVAAMIFIPKAIEAFFMRKKNMAKNDQQKQAFHRKESAIVAEKIERKRATATAAPEQPNDASVVENGRATNFTIIRTDDNETVYADTESPDFSMPYDDEEEFDTSTEVVDEIGMNPAATDRDFYKNDILLDVEKVSANECVARFKRDDGSLYEHILPYVYWDDGKLLELNSYSDAQTMKHRVFYNKVIFDEFDQRNKIAQVCSANNFGNRLTYIRLCEYFERYFETDIANRKFVTKQIRKSVQNKRERERKTYG